MGLPSRAFLAGGLGFAVAFVVACGGSGGLLSGNQGSSLNAQLDAVSTALDSRDCGAAASGVTSLNAAITNLPSTVNTTLLQNLGQGAATVGQLAARDCPSSTSPTSSSSSSSSSSTTTSSSTPTVPSSSSTDTGTSTHTTTSSSTTTSTPTSSTSSTSNGGAGLGGGGTGTSGNGGRGQ